MDSRWPTSKGEGRDERGRGREEREKKREGTGRGGMGKEGQGRPPKLMLSPPRTIFLAPTLLTSGR